MKKNMSRMFKKIKYKLEYTCLKDICETVSICFDPNRTVTLIDEDTEILNKYFMFEKLINEVNGVDDDDDENDTSHSKWIIRLELSKIEMLEKSISMDDIHFAIKTSIKQDVECIYSDFNSDNLIFRIRLTNGLLKNKKTSLDQEDQIYMLKNLQENLLNNIVLRGIANIPKVVIRKVSNNLKLKNGNYVSQDTWVLDTVGSNLIDILALDYIDRYKTITNDIQEVYKVLGVEAARQTIYNEIEEVMSFDGTYINHHHMAMLCDRMTATKHLVSIFRHGINNDDIGPIAKASFEETPEMFLKAARHAELDIMTGVSANVMVGQEGKFGTGTFQVILDLKKMEQYQGEIIESKIINLENVLGIENPDDKCSINNIKINSSVDYINPKDTGDIDEEYDPGF